MAWDKSSSHDIGQFDAAADLSSKQYYCVYFDASGTVSLASAAGQRVDGILQNNPLSGQSALVRPFGVSKAVVGAGGCTVGDLLKTDASGKVTTAALGTVNTSDAGATNDPVIGSNVIGKALATGVSGDVIPVLLLPGGVAPTTAA